MKKAAICTVGDEILIGQITDTNSSAIASRLNSIGVRVCRMISVGDDTDDMMKTFDSLLRSSDIVVITGGLGPTKDDRTKKVLAGISGSTEYVFHDGQMNVIKHILAGRGIGLTDMNKEQAMVPSKADVIINHKGTAPCMVLRFSKDRYPHEPVLYSLPGVPFEALALLPDIMDDIKSHFSLDNIYHKTLTTYGIAESELAKTIGKWEESLPEDMHLAYLPDPLVGVRLRLSIYGGRKECAVLRIDEEFDKVRRILGNAVYGEADDTLQSVIAEKLIRSGKTLSVAESCTGGRIASLFTAMPGASRYFYGSVTSYDNSVKHNILHVPTDIITSKGAVSRECAEAMAAGVLDALGTDFALSTTGIAGPDGGTPDKPVGTLWTAVAYTEVRQPGNVIVRSRMFRFNNDRQVNIDRFAGSALNTLRHLLDEVLLP